MPFGTLDQFHVANNGALTNLASFPPNLTSVDTLMIEGNANLESLKSIKPTIATLYVRDNTKLPTSLAEAYRDLEPVTSSGTISRNDSSGTCSP